MKILEIFCDGGFGNRYNALVSGLAIANRLRIDFKVYWPVNNWCGASLEDLIEPKWLVINKNINQLASEGGVRDLVLHDDIPAKIFNKKYTSAYGFTSIEDFWGKYKESDVVLFYPALIPSWISSEEINLASTSIKLRKEFIQEAESFINEKIGTKDYYGLHLRRTDFNVGYSDDEVQKIVSAYSKNIFFVCSDDPVAEKKADLFENVRVFRKSDWVKKLDVNGNWLDATYDSDGRLYNGNINRSSQSVKDALVDMLILGHSKMVGQSPSTFKSVAAMVARSNLVKYSCNNLASIDYPSMAELRRLAISRQWGLFSKNLQAALDKNHLEIALEALRFALNFVDKEKISFFYLIIAKLLIGINRFGESLVYISAAENLDPKGEELERMRKMVISKLQY